MPKLRFLFVLVISFAMSIILCKVCQFLLCVCLKLSGYLIVPGSSLNGRHVFNLRAIEKDLSLVNGFTKFGLHHRPLQKRERTGKEYGCFPFVRKTKIFKWKVN